MFLTDIQLENFRNYKSLSLQPDEKINIILGANAQGKTNLLEAIYFSAVGKSFKTVRDADVINFDAQFTKINIKAEKTDFNTDVNISIKKTGKKEIKKDGVKLKKVSELSDNILVVVFSPEDLKIVKDEPEKRRKFIDRELCLISPYYLDNLINYKKTLFQRNFYLKENLKDKKMLEIWDKQLSFYGTNIINRRRDFIIKLKKYVEDIHKSVTNGTEHVKIEYKPDIDIEKEEEFYDVVINNRERDIKIGNTTKGPHKDDVDFLINGVNVRRYGSQGQQRTSALSLKLAELSLIKEETGETAILLLDDVMSELDSNRQEYLIHTLKENQIFITGTEIDKNIEKAFPKGNKIFVKQGKIYTEGIN